MLILFITICSGSVNELISNARITVMQASMITVRMEKRAVVNILLSRLFEEERLEELVRVRGA